jgi:ABC-type dipeptide/oligopeptide/nickel transport system permease subunit
LTEQQNITPEQRVEQYGQAALGIPAPSGGLHELMPDGGEVQVISSGWRLSVREFASNRLALVAVGVLVAIILFCYLGPVVYHTNQTLSNPLNASLAPGSASPFNGHTYPLGTDENGFDELGRIMLGGQSALEIGAFAALVAIVIGTVYGAISGLIGGFVDAVMMRFVDILLSIPFLLIVLVLATKYNGTVISISLILGVFSWLIPARLVRGEVLTLRERDFVVAAQTMGSSRTRLISRHLIPNAMSVTIVNVTFLIADSIIYLAVLGFLGFGLQFPDTSWGDMLGNADQYVQNGQWWLVFPVGGMLVVVVLCANLIGDALRDAVDVRLRRR